MSIPRHKEWHINLGFSIIYHKLYPKTQCKKTFTNKSEWDIKGIFFINEFYYNFSIIYSINYCRHCFLKLTLKIIPRNY